MLWLDDIGLPQFRDTFAENMIDGQMLLALTVQDLVEMKVVSAMNHATVCINLCYIFGAHVFCNDKIIISKQQFCFDFLEIVFNYLIFSLLVESNSLKQSTLTFIV